MSGEGILKEGPLLLSALPLPLTVTSDGSTLVGEKTFEQKIFSAVHQF